jgi:hypothetical protein
MASMGHGDDRDLGRGRPQGRVVGGGAELWRYPVESMRGATVPRLMVAAQHSRGDRAIARRDLTTGPIRVAVVLDR